MRWLSSTTCSCHSDSSTWNWDTYHIQTIAKINLFITEISKVLNTEVKSPLTTVQPQPLTLPSSPIVGVIIELDCQLYRSESHIGDYWSTLPAVSMWLMEPWPWGLHWSLASCSLEWFSYSASCLPLSEYRWVSSVTPFCQYVLASEPANSGLNALKHKPG